MKRLAIDVDGLDIGNEQPPKRQKTNHVEIEYLNEFNLDTNQSEVMIDHEKEKESLKNQSQDYSYNVSFEGFPKTNQTFDHQNPFSFQMPKQLDSIQQRIEKRVMAEKQRIMRIAKRKFDQKRFEMHTFFNDLQAIFKRYNMKMNTPQVFVVGMQSDGKSSFVEALLGFKFNQINSQIGTRRPLILQMQNDPTKHSPECVFLNTTEKEMKGYPFPPEKIFSDGKEIQKEIQRRTIAICGESDVSEKPIILRVRFKSCSNLTIYDFPGFRKGENDPLSEKIENMVLSTIKKNKNYIILCLEQSTVEWCNTQVKPIIAKVDPTFQNTIFLSTKFNNRINQFQDAQEVNDYIQNGTDYCKNSKVFFISLPAGFGINPSLDSQSFREEIFKTYLQDYRNLVRIGFKEKQFKPLVGFFHVDLYLEQELQKRYDAAINPLYAELSQMIKDVREKTKYLASQLEHVEKMDVRTESSSMITSFCQTVQKAIKGSMEFYNLKSGQTSMEERTNCSRLSRIDPTWPGFKLEKSITFPNSNFKLYGGSQLRRLISEFEVVGHSIEFPKTTDNEVAVSIGMNSKNNFPNLEDAATDIVEKKCREVFVPLVNTLLIRAKYVSGEMMSMILNYYDVKKHKHISFLNEFVKTSRGFIDSIVAKLRKKLFDELHTFTTIIDWDLFFYKNSKPKTKEHNQQTENPQANLQINSQINPQANTQNQIQSTVQEKEEKEYPYLNPTAEDTIKRIKKMQEEKRNRSYALFGLKNETRTLTPEVCQKIKLASAKLFAGIRCVYVNSVRLQFTSQFIFPLQSGLENHLRSYFNKLSQDQLKSIVFVNLKETKKQENIYKVKYKELRDQITKIKNIQNKLNMATSK